MDEADTRGVPDRIRRATGPPAAEQREAARLAVPAHLGPLLTEIADLKRVRCGGWRGRSLADAAFRRAWLDLAEGGDPDLVASGHAAFAAAHASLGPVDETAMADAGVPEEERRRIYLRAAGRALGSLDDSEDLALRALAAGPSPDAALPAAALSLVDRRWHEPDADEPYDPAEDAIRFSEHVWTVAAMAAVIERARGEAGGHAFLLALVHHLPDIVAPDELTEALAAWPAEVAGLARTLLSRRRDVGWRIASAFNAADGVDAVIERRQAVNRAGLSLSDWLTSRDIVPPGPLAAFHHRILLSLGLAY
jgi:hypothetical protein